MKTRNLLLICAIAVLPGMAFAQSGPYQYYAVAPCRFVDTRPSSCPGAFPSENCPAARVFVRATRTFTLKSYCSVPSDAKAAVINVTVLQPSVYGDLRFYPGGGSTPYVSTINFTDYDLAIANAAIVPLATSSTLDLETYLNSPYGTSGVDGTHLVLDVVGYFK